MTWRLFGRLMRDSLWRGRMAWLWVGVCVLAAWGLVAAGLDARAGVATSLAGVFALGPMTSLTSVVVRETRFLPVTSRDVWVVAWVLSSLVATLFVVVLQAVSLGIGMAAGYPQPQALPSLVFVGLGAFAYGGAMLPVGPLIGYTAHAATERRPRSLWIALATLAMLIYFGALVVPWVAWTVLPTSFAALNLWSASALVAGIVAAIGSVAWTPQRFGGAGRPTAHAAVAPNADTRRARASMPSVLRAADRLTGLSRLLLPTATFVFVAAVAAAGACMLYVDTFMPTTSLYQAFAGFGLLPFSAAGLSSKSIMGTAMFAPFIALSSGLGWDGYARHLRVLPLSAADTTRLFLTTTVMAWAVLWIVLLGLHVVILGFGPTTLRPELFLYLSGVSALVEAMWRGRKKPGLTFAAVMLVTVVDILAGRFGVTAMFWIHVTTGAAAQFIAAVVTYRSLTRSSSSARVYQSTTPSLTA